MKQNDGEHDHLLLLVDGYLLLVLAFLLSTTKKHVNDC